MHEIFSNDNVVHFYKNSAFDLEEAQYKLNLITKKNKETYIEYERNEILLTVQYAELRLNEV